MPDKKPEEQKPSATSAFISNVGAAASGTASNVKATFTPAPAKPKPAAKKKKSKKKQTVVTLADGTKHTFAGHDFDAERNLNPDTQLLSLPDGTLVAWSEVASIDEK